MDGLDFETFQNLIFGPGTFWTLLTRSNLLSKIKLRHALTSCKKSGKSGESFLKNCIANGWKNGRTNKRKGPNSQNTSAGVGLKKHWKYIIKD